MCQARLGGRVGIVEVQPVFTKERRQWLKRNYPSANKKRRGKNRSIRELTVGYLALDTTSCPSLTGVTFHRCPGSFNWADNRDRLPGNFPRATTWVAGFRNLGIMRGEVPA